MSKAIIISRVSTNQQDLIQQTNVLKEEALRSGYKEEDLIVIEHHESAIKNDLSERQGLQRTMEYINNDKSIDCVFIYEISRLARRSVVLYEMRDFFIDKKVQLICMKPYFKLLENGKMSQTASILFSLMGTLAEQEMTIKLERFMRAKNEMTKQGKKSAGSVKFGYKKTKDSFVVADDYTSNIVNMIYSHYIDESNTSLYETYIWMTGQWPEIFGSLPYKKAQHKVRNLLTDITYLGNWCYPQIVTEELRDKVMNKMSNARCKARYNTKHVYLGRGKLYCRHCGKMMTPVGGRTKAYNCVTDKLHNMTINVDNIDKLIWEEEVRPIANINAGIDNNAKISQLADDIKSKENVRNGYLAEEKRLVSMQEKLLSLYLDGKINDTLYNNKNNDINNQLSVLKKKKERIDAEIKELESLSETTRKSIVEVQSINYDNVTDDNIKIELIRKYIDKIWVEKIANHTYRLEFEYRGCIVPQRGVYIYKSSGGYIKVWRINADETEDRIV